MVPKVNKYPFTSPLDFKFSQIKEEDIKKAKA
jgi:hypothetical protein